MKRLTIIGALLIVLIGMTGVNFPLMAAAQNGREITIVARNMAFVVESSELSDETNPTITVRAGQRITIIVRNIDPGMLHDFVIQGLGVQAADTSYGEVTRVTFTAPQEPGEYIYLCSFHPRSMRGIFVVE